MGEGEGEYVAGNTTFPFSLPLPGYIFGKFISSCQYPVQLKDWPKIVIAVRKLNDHLE